MPLNFSITNKILFECFRLLVTLTFWAAFAKGRGGEGAKLSRAANAKSAVKNFAEICDVLLGSHSLSVFVCVCECVPGPGTFYLHFNFALDAGRRFMAIAIPSTALAY